MSAFFIDIYQRYFLLKRNGSRHDVELALYYQFNDYENRQTIAVAEQEFWVPIFKIDCQLVPYHNIRKKLHSIAIVSVVENVFVKKFELKMRRFIGILANSQLHFINLTRGAIFIVMVWIGGLKAFQYEADGIVPFVANSPLMSFFYNKKAPEYKQYKNPEGKTVQKNIDWHKENGTYPFSYGLGAVIIIIGLLTFAGIWNSKAGVVGGVLTAGMSLVTLSFLITTPEVFVPKLDGDFETPQYGFPYLSAAGRLVIKDVIMLGAGLICASDSAKQLLSLKRNKNS